MESRPRSRLRITELRPAPARHGAGPCCPDGDCGGADRISGLPDDVLLHVLARLRCARAAAHASLISRRWRGLWRHLPELSFRGVAPAPLGAALAQVARAELSLLDIDVADRHRLHPADVASLLRAAARLAPAELRFAVWGLPDDRSTAVVEVPCFHRATSVELSALWVAMALPEEGGGGFPVAERLSIDGCGFDFGALISRCPRLRLLEATRVDGIGALTVRSPTIESLHVDGVSLGGIDVVAPLLKKFTLTGSNTKGNLTASFSAPMVRNFHWSAHFRHWWILVGAMWGLCRFSLCLQEESVYRLHLRIEAQDICVAVENVKLKQKIAQFPYFSILQISIVTCGHIYGAAVLNVLEVCTDIKRLRLVIHELKFKNPCPQNCCCDQPYNWRDQNIALAALEEVEIKGFQGAGHEVDLLKLILRCAPMLKVMTVILSDEVSPCISGCEEICRVLMACPSLKWSVYPQPL